MKLVFNRASLRKGTFSHIKFFRLLKDVALIILLWMCVKTWMESGLLRGQFISGEFM